MLCKLFLHSCLWLIKLTTTVVLVLAVFYCKGAWTCCTSKPWTGVTTRMHITCYCAMHRGTMHVLCLVSCPDPTLCEGKGVWWIWTQSSGQGKEFERSNEIAALAQSYDSPTAGMHSAIACYINLNRRPAPKQQYWPIRSKVCFNTTVAARVHWAGQTKKTVQLHQTPFPLQRVGSGDETSAMLGILPTLNLPPSLP